MLVYTLLRTARNSPGPRLRRATRLLLKTGGASMAQAWSIARTAVLRFGFALLIGFLINTVAAFAQYPSQSEINKDGTAILLEDYASLPLSSPTHAGKPAG